MELYKEGNNCIVLKHVLYLDKGKSGAWIVQAGTTWNQEIDSYNNAQWLTAAEVPQFEQALENYLEANK